MGGTECTSMKKYKAIICIDNTKTNIHARPVVISVVNWTGNISVMLFKPCKLNVYNNHIKGRWKNAPKD